ncbi:YqgE/AlgH family protein [Gabonibacter chumensis]|uniref:YqgE/AlgH family protein n=1 Tax=Gabonibacter chumensis TaxID=2972474 RepID=UPI0025722B1B|nr:YqgE/AlgH family protein [Gabonibacter chumensis]
MEEQFQDLFRIRHNSDRVEIGKVLIAEPFLQGNYFNRSVVYIVEHDETGSVGFVLNKPLPYTTSQLVKGLEGIELPVYLGGPVERNQLYYIHRKSGLTGALMIREGIYWGGNFRLLAEWLKSGKMTSGDVRFFAGYSGWNGKQLQGELEENSWMVGDIETEILFQLPNPQLWEQSMGSLGGRYKIWANFPEDPIMN